MCGGGGSSVSTCPECGSKDTYIVRARNDTSWHIFRCRKCGEEYDD